MSIYMSSNPVDWGLLDGVYIDESAPPPSVTGVPTGVAICIGQFERGSNGLQPVGSTGQLYQLYGNNLTYSGQKSLQNKKFGLLKVVRVVASDAVAGSHTFLNASPSSAVIFTALWKGVYGNNITVKIEAGSIGGKKYTVHDGNANSPWPDEVYDNVSIATLISSLAFANSNLVVPSVVSTAQEPANIAATALGSGSDGTIADTDYQTAIAKTEIAGAGNIVFLDAYNATRRGYLKTSMANTTDKMSVLAGVAAESVATSLTNVSSCRDTDGRLIYVFPFVYTTIGGVSTLINGASFYAAMLSQIAPNIDPAYAANTQYLSGIESLELDLTRSDYISLAAGGISAFEMDADIGPKVKSGVVTQIANSSKIMVFRRRMADFIVQSLGKYLKNWQNAPNSERNRVSVNGAITSFNSLLENSQLVPKDSEVQTGKASIIDTKSLNTDDSIAAGYFKILYKRRIYSSMRYIVLQAEIGESVVVTEQG